jgi:ribose transport system permease protein
MDDLEHATVEPEPEGTIGSGTPAMIATAPALTDRFTTYVANLARFDVVAVMPYIYVLVLGGALFVLQRNLLIGSGAVDARATAVLPLAMVAMGETFAIFTRGIDLSVGGILSLTTAILATHGQPTGISLMLELVGVVVLGAILGSLNGIVIALSRLQPFIVTLATWSIWDGVALKILPTEGGSPPPDLSSAIVGDILGVPKSVWGIALLFLAWIWFRNTRFVTDLKAIGSDEGRARLIGVSLVRRKVQVYMLSGIFAAGAGVWISAATASGAPNAGDQFILNSIAAVVVGGTSIFGGIGSGARTIVGAIALLMIPDVIFALNLASFWSIFFQGFLLIVAVTISSVILQVRTAQAR